MRISDGVQTCALPISVAGMGFMFISERLFARGLRPVIGIAFRSLMNRPNSRTIVQNADDAALLERRMGVRRDRPVVFRGSGVDIDRFRPAPEPAGTPVDRKSTRLNSSH